MNSKTMTLSAFARHRGVSRQTVWNWQRAGLVVTGDGGAVDVAKTERLLAERPAVRKGGAVKQPPSPVLHGETVEQAAERIVVDEGKAPHTLAEAARLKENYLAKLRQLEFDQKSGAVVDVAEVGREVASEYAAVRAALLAVPAKVAPRVALLKTAEEVRAALDDALSQALEGLTRDHLQVGA